MLDHLSETEKRVYILTDDNVDRLCALIPEFGLRYSISEPPPRRIIVNQSTSTATQFRAVFFHSHSPCSFRVVVSQRHPVNTDARRIRNNGPTPFYEPPEESELRHGNQN
jgi:hypothetical protein